MLFCVKCGRPTYEHNDDEGFDLFGDESAIICWGCYLEELRSWLGEIHDFHNDNMTVLEVFEQYLRESYLIERDRVIQKDTTNRIL